MNEALKVLLERRPAGPCRSAAPRKENYIYRV